MSTDMSETTQHYYKNSLLLEADIEEEMQSLQEEIDRKEKTIQDIMNLPKKIAYDCMVPLSKVAFTPGRMVHTNEFSVQVDAKSGARQWMSHVEAADHLRGEVTRIQGDISQLRDYLVARRSGSDSGGQKSTSATVDTDSSQSIKKIVPSSSNSTSRAVKQKEQEKQEQEQEQGEYVPFSDELASSSGGLEGESDDEEEEDDEAWTSAGASGSGGEGFEIREYCDKDGNILDGQIVDLSAELSQLQTEQKKQQQQQESKQGVGAGGEEGEGGSPGGGVDNLVNDINEKLNVPNPAGPVELDQDALFVRELAEISSASSKSKKTKSVKGTHKTSNCSHEDDERNLDSLFADLEKQEESALSSQTAASKGLFSSSKWKKGFLSSSSSSSSPKKAKKKTVATSTTKPPPTPAGAAAGAAVKRAEVSVPGAKVPLQEYAPADITQHNTLPNKTTHTSAQNYLGSSIGSGRDKDGDIGSAGDNSVSSPPPPAAKKVSRFKQNRTATAAATASSTSSSMPSSSSSLPRAVKGKTVAVPFTGHIVEK